MLCDVLASNSSSVTFLFALLGTLFYAAVTNLQGFAKCSNVDSKDIDIMLITICIHTYMSERSSSTKMK